MLLVDFHFVQVWCIVSNIFGSELSVLTVNPPTECDQNELKLRLAKHRAAHTVIHENTSIESAISEASGDSSLTVLSW